MPEMSLIISGIVIGFPDWVDPPLPLPGGEFPTSPGKYYSCQPLSGGEFLFRIRGITGKTYPCRPHQKRENLYSLESLVLRILSEYKRWKNL